MEGEEQQQSDDRTNRERDIEAWNLPRPVLVGPALDEWPEREPAEEGLESSERPRAAWRPSR